MASFASQYRALSLVDTLTPDIPPNEGALPHIWELDSQIRAEFDGMIQMYEQGLLHSMEFLAALNVLVNKERN